MPVLPCCHFLHALYCLALVSGQGGLLLQLQLLLTDPLFGVMDLGADVAVSLVVLRAHSLLRDALLGSRLLVFD